MVVSRGDRSALSEGTIAYRNDRYGPGYKKTLTKVGLQIGVVCSQIGLYDT
jgi:hypothetical protein